MGVHDADDSQDDTTMERVPVNRVISPSADQMEGSPGPAGKLEGQLGPDELPDPDEVIRKKEAESPFSST